jgi:hypothetical protein
MGTPINPNTDAILEMWKTGLTGGQIARNLGITRNTVMGILGRCRVAGKIDYRMGAERIIAVRAKIADANRKRASVIGEFLHTAIIGGDLPSNQQTSGITLMKLKPSSCRYIIGKNADDEALFCGEQRTASSYCKTHHKLCYTHVAKLKENPNAVTA